MLGVCRPLSRVAVIDLPDWREAIPAGAPARYHIFGWRRRQAFPAAAGGAP